MSPAELFRLRQYQLVRCSMSRAKRVVPGPSELAVLRQEENSVKKASLSEQVQQGHHSLDSPGLPVLIDMEVFSIIKLKQ